MTQFCLSRGTKSLLDNEFLFGMNTVATPLLIGIKNRSLSMDPGVQMACDDEASSGSGDDGHMLDGNSKRHSVGPSNSGRRKRGRKATGDAIVDAMLEIAAASKMRAAAIMKNEDRFSISKCIKLLDEMQGVDQQIYFRALDLFENPNARETFISLKNERRLPWLQGKCGSGSS